MDLFSRKIVGWSAGPTIHRELVLNAVLTAVRQRRPLKKHIYKNRELALNDVSDYIETFYNRTRRHGHLGGVSPEQFEAAQKPRRRGIH
jgi:transposase InsO family protein